MADQTLSYALTTVPRVKARLGITETSFDEVLKGRINSVTDFLERICDRQFKRQTVASEIHSVDESGRSMIFLKQAPVASVSAFEYNVGTKSNPSWTPFPADDWYLDEDGKSGIIHYAGSLPVGPNIIRVTYVAGYLVDFNSYGNYALHTLPAELTDLAERLVEKRHKRRDHEAQASSSANGGSIQWADFLDDADRDVISLHQRTRFI